MIRFTKMHGLGNDYVVIDGTAHRVADPTSLTRRMAERHFGIGGDGLILLLRPRAGVEADIRMRMFNPDGSEAEMCGNGIRCACKLARDRGLVARRPMRIETAAGVLVLHDHPGPDGTVGDVSVDMGAPVTEAERLPVRAIGVPRLVDVPLATLLGEPGPEALRDRVEGEPTVTCVSMGNPHAVLFCRDVSGAPLERIGSPLETHTAFPERINVHLVEVLDVTELRMRSWERGAGATLACGTGACAAVVAGALSGRTGREASVHLPGGDLHIRWDETTDHVIMTGPATEVFVGTWPGTP